MVKGKHNIHKTLHRTLKIQQHEPRCSGMVISSCFTSVTLVKEYCDNSLNRKERRFLTTTIVSELGGIIFKLFVKMKMTAHEWSFDGKLTECLCRSKIQGGMQFYNDQWCIIFCLIIINRKQVLRYFVVYQLVLLFVLYIMCMVCWSSSVSMMEHNFLTTQHIAVY